jgi:hypothetical protein
LKYPELEIIPGGPTTHRILEELGDVEKESKKYEQRLQALEKVKLISEPAFGVESNFGPSPKGSHELRPNRGCVIYDDTLGVSAKPSSAEAWSRIYDDCIQTLCDDADATSMGSVTSQFKTRESENLRGRGRRLAAVSASTELRGSTVEFKELQAADEKKSRTSLLRMVEEVWRNVELTTRDAMQMPR